MANSEGRGKYWIMFLAALALTVALLIFIPQWFWVPLPFVFTGFVMALGWI